MGKMAEMQKRLLEVSLPLVPYQNDETSRLSFRRFSNGHHADETRSAANDGTGSDGCPGHQPRLVDRESLPELPVRDLSASDLRKHREPFTHQSLTHQLNLGPLH